MTAELIDTLIKQSPLVAVLILSGYILWKRYDTFTARTQQKLDDSEKRIMSYMENDRAKLIEVVSDNTDALKAILRSNDRTNKVMECMIEEVKEFKKSEVYLHFKGAQK